MRQRLYADLNHEYSVSSLYEDCMPWEWVGAALALHCSCTNFSAGHQLCSLSDAVLRLASIQREVVVAGRGYSELKG